MRQPQWHMNTLEAALDNWGYSKTFKITRMTKSRLSQPKQHLSQPKQQKLIELFVTE